MAVSAGFAERMAGSALGRSSAPSLPPPPFPHRHLAGVESCCAVRRVGVGSGFPMTASLGQGPPSSWLFPPTQAVPVPWGGSRRREPEWQGNIVLLHGGAER